jgi:benzoyl-CoA reductase/2-hydroxyglutaryl-CoA dehydratase subunit BcrC/BadD/HgdB
MTPNRTRLDLLQDIIARYHIDGVVELTWESCLTYNVEAFLVREYVQEKCGRPYIQIRTDYSQNDREQIRTRIEAFLEILTPGTDRLPAQS